MNPILRNFLAIIAGIAVGAIVNSAIVSLCSGMVPPPEGVDPMDVESIKANIHLYQPKHFVIPFIAHALGTLFGAFIGARIAVSNQMRIAIGLGFFFLIGGIAMVMMVPGGPVWFTALDLLVAYLPMAYLGGKIAGGNRALPKRIYQDILD